MRLLDTERPARERTVNPLPDEMRSEVAREMPCRETVIAHTAARGAPGDRQQRRHRVTRTPEQRGP